MKRYKYKKVKDFNLVSHCPKSQMQPKSNSTLHGRGLGLWLSVNDCVLIVGMVPRTSDAGQFL